MTEFVTPQSSCQMGVARGDITPPVGIYHRMWGAATHDRATGIHRPLTATAVVFRPLDGPETEEQVLIAVDHCLLWGREMSDLLEHLTQSTTVPRERILVVFSHTHAAGLMGRERAHLPGGDLISPYLGKLGETLATLVREARQSVRPVTLTYATGHCSLAAQRDFWDAQSRQYVCGFHPGAPADDTVLVVRATDTASRMVATFVNYACHPTTLAWENTLISPDYPGALREVVEKHANAPCLFLQGASGDLGPREGFVGDTAIADRNGRQLAYAVLEAIESMPPPATHYVYRGPIVSGATLGQWTHEPLAADALPRRWWRCHWSVDLPYRPDLRSREHTEQERSHWQFEEAAALSVGDAARARDCRAQIERMTRWLTRLEALPEGPVFPMPVTAWRMGDAYWIALEAEHYQHLQRSLRERFPGVPLLVMTLANGSRASYLPTKEAYGKGIYQESIAVLAAGSLERLSEEIGDAIAESK